jgi:general secretion pathway protein K
MMVVSNQESAMRKPAGSGLPAVDCRLHSQSGVVLIAVLWIFVALAVIALSFSKESFVEVAAARNAQSLENSYFAARAGLMTTIYQLIQKRQPQNQQLALQETPDAIDLGSVTGNFGGYAYRVDLQDESGKINVNNPVLEEQLQKQLQKLCEVIGIKKEDADIITDSILDWRDGDSLHRMNGAEDDYYQALNPPYKAKNSRLDTIEEMLLIRGVTPEYFYGRPERSPDGSIIYKYGLSRYLTVYANTNTINVNYAPLPVLVAIGLAPEAAEQIYNRRRTKPFKDLAEVARELNLGPTMNLPISVIQTGIYTLTASARAENSKVRRILRTVINIPPGNPNGDYRVMYWNENVPDYESATQ